MAGRAAVWSLPLLGALAAGPAGASELVDFARCITRAGARYYTAAWCPHCARQSKLFGNAIRYVNVVDCTAGCTGVDSFPTWTFRDGSRLSGVATLDELASRTRCRMGGASEDASSGTTAPSVGSPGARERNAGGARIIEVPRH